jgi:hypothetical protein
MGTDENVPFVWKSGLATSAGLCDCPHRESTIEFRQADCRSLGFAPKELKNKPGFRFVCCCGTSEGEICVSHPSQEREGWGTRTLVPTRRNSPAAVAGLRKKDCSVALQEVLDWIGYEQRDICWKVSIL